MAVRPFAIVSDQHFHEWNAFATTNEKGINSRLQLQLDELRRCAKELRAAGGNTIYNAGDTYHVRGSLSPTVLNPVMDLHRELIRDGFNIVVMAGNHDLASKDSNRLSSAVTSLESTGCKVISGAALGMDDVVMVSWIQSVADLKAELERIASGMTKEDLGHTSLILHAPLDGVIIGIPDHGLNGEWLAKLGFKRVFCGHYHSHREVVPGVYSIGATSHQTWGDVGSKAGFLVVSDGDVRWFKSHAPEFVEITDKTNPDDIPFMVDGNFVRAKINSAKPDDVQEMRDYLTGCGAKGVTILAQKAASVSARTGTAITAGATTDASVGDFIKSQGYANAEKLAIVCHEILSNVRSAA